MPFVVSNLSKEVTERREETWVVCASVQPCRRIGGRQGQLALVLLSSVEAKEETIGKC